MFGVIGDYPDGIKPFFLKKKELQNDLTLNAIISVTNRNP
ncbi:hypothetical protein GCM10010911_72760 [Paenibacillus nasutitermitis]|uniref:Uncharacterized protein n=1 Tax=Paenibacillus nasutitermitis TaxID=1652958 RepID=A0A917E4M4_9BACL|nr:hypothetical protein GCM10010911_72760 [Paenibacillus nasutitermitis]